MARQYCCDRCGGDWAGNARPVFYDNIWAAWGMQPHELLCDTCALNYAGGKYQLSQLVDCRWNQPWMTPSKRRKKRQQGQGTAGAR